MDSGINTRGRELIYLCQSTGLRIVNGRCFEDKGIGAFSFRGSNGKSVNDYLLSDEEMYNSLSNFSIGEKWPDTDHHPVYFNFGMTTEMPESGSKGPNNCEEPYSKFIWNEDCKPEMNICLFEDTGVQYLNDFYDSIRELDSVDNVANKFNSYISQACDRSLKCTKGHGNTVNKFPVNPWFDSDCKEAKANYHAADRSNRPEDEVKDLEKEYNRIKRRKKRQFHYKNFMKIQDCNNPRELWAELNKLKGKESTPNRLSMKDFFSHFSKPPIINTDNKYEFDLAHESNMRDLLKGKSQPVSSSVNDSQLELMQDVLNEIITESEVTGALKTLKKGKSPGSDGIPIDVFIALGDELTPFLTHLFNYIFINGIYPESWSTGIISPVPKVPTPKTSEQFRRISLLPAISKIFDTIMNTRLEFIDNAFRLDDIFNGGFKKGSRTTDN